MSRRLGKDRSSERSFLADIRASLLFSDSKLDDANQKTGNGDPKHDATVCDLIVHVCSDHDAVWRFFRPGRSAAFLFALASFSAAFMSATIGFNRATKGDISYSFDVRPPVL